MIHNFTSHDTKNKINIKKQGVGLKNDYHIERYDAEHSRHDKNRYITIGQDHKTKVLFVSHNVRDTDNPFDDSDIDYSGIDNLSDDEVHEGAISDPDAQPVTKEQFKEFNRVSPTKNNRKLNKKIE